MSANSTIGVGVERGSRTLTPFRALRPERSVSAIPPPRHIGAQAGSRTRTTLRSPAPQASVSTYSTTWAFALNKSSGSGLGPPRIPVSPPLQAGHALLWRTPPLQLLHMAGLLGGGGRTRTCTPFRARVFRIIEHHRFNAGRSGGNRTHPIEVWSLHRLSLDMRPYMAEQEGIEPSDLATNRLAGGPDEPAFGSVPWLIKSDVLMPSTASRTSDLIGRVGGTRTHKVLQPAGFEPALYANSSTTPCCAIW